MSSAAGAAASQPGTGSPSESVLGAGDYLLGSLWLLVVIAALGFAAWRLRALLLPGWTGAPARLAESVLGVFAAIALGELLGSFGLFTAAGMLIASLMLAGLAALLARPRRAPAGESARAGATEEPRPKGEGAAPPAPGSSRAGLWVSVGAVAALMAGWAVPTLGALAAGMDRADSLWYHMPLSAEFVQSGSTTAIHHFDPIFFATYYPANSELLHAIPILGFERDFVSPFLNVAFLGLGLLGCWCIGRPFGVAPQALVGGALILGSQSLIEYQAGESLNDIVGVALVLAAAALLVNGFLAARGRGEGLPKARGSGGLLAAVAIAGLATGMAAGTKLSFLAPALALAVGVAVIAPAGLRARLGAAFVGAALLGGGYWFARNLIQVGNPIPFYSFGPLDLPSPDRDFELRPGNSVLHYWNQPGVWVDWFAPGLRESFGLLWPLTLLALAAGAVALALRGREPVVRMLAAVAIFGSLAYLVTPLTAGGEEGRPIAFVWNVRYIAPGAALGLALVALLPALRASERRRMLTLAALAVLLLATVVSLVQWQQGHVKGAVAAGLLSAAIGAAALLLGGRLGRRALAGLAVLALVGLLGAGWLIQRHYLIHRYDSLSAPLKIAGAVRWGNGLSDSSVAVSGIRGVFNQYPFYGAELSNRVQWLGVPGPEGAWLRVPDCETWREQLNAGGYRYVVTMYDPFTPGELTDTKQALWTREDPAAEEVLRDGPVSVFELDGELDPSACDGLPTLSEAELNGDSVNAEPLANQPPGTGPLARGGDSGAGPKAGAPGGGEAG